MKIQFCICLLFILQSSAAQDFKLMRYEENYASYADSTKNYYHKLKHLPIVASRGIYLTLGGELRAELDYVQNENWGYNNEGRDLFVLQRYQLHTDLHLGQRIRIFGQLRSGLEQGRKNGPRPIDEDKLNVQNLFVDIIPYKRGEKRLLLRIGRQELRYGSGRLIDVRDGPNLRLYFDGAKVVYSTKDMQLDAFVMSDGKVKPGVIDNVSNKQANLWGLYSSLKDILYSNIDVYYLGINRSSNVYDAGVGEETRHTIGTRIWSNKRPFLYNFETAAQFGKFGHGRIAAFAVSSEIGYAIKQIKGFPTVKLKADYISGDQDRADSRLGTFQALYPNGGYFGMNPQLGPANLISLHPSLHWNYTKKLSFTLESVFNWRNSLDDGVYNPNGSFRLSSSNSNQHYIGTAFIQTSTWHINKFVDYNFGIQYFKIGDFVQDVVPSHKDVFFVGSMLRFMF